MLCGADKLSRATWLQSDRVLLKILVQLNHSGQAIFLIAGWGV